MLELFPETAAVENGELTIAGLGATQLATEFGTPLLVYDERTMLEAARAYRVAAPKAFVAYGVKAFPNVSVLELLAGEGLGADVATLGELTIALRAGFPGDRLIVHGNNKSVEELEAAARAGAWLVVIDAPDEIELAAEAGVERVLVRTTPGVEADTHPAIKTAHHGSKFGLPPEQTLEAIGRARDVGLEVAGLHVHIGSQLLDDSPAIETVEWLAGFAERCRRELDWAPGIVDLGGGLGIQYVEGRVPPSISEFVGTVVWHLNAQWRLLGVPSPQLVLEPGRSIVGRAGITLYEIGAVKEVMGSTRYVAVDGGMSDNPRPQLYQAQYTGLLANRADESTNSAYTICGKHCESGDVMVRDLQLPEPRRGDLLAVPATGAYTLTMASNYNLVPRPAAVLVRDGEARLIRRRETIDDLFRLETGAT
jgi:diaminopimelate decarboxylase